VGSRDYPLPRPTKLLPPRPGQCPLILPLPLPPQKRPLVLRDGNPAELLPLRNLQPQLALPVVFATHPHLDHHPAAASLLHRHLVPPPHHAGARLHRSRLVYPHLRRIAWRTQMVPDALVDVRHRALCPYRDVESDDWCAIVQVAVVVVGGAGCVAGDRARDDPPANTHPLPRRRDAVCESGGRVCDDDRGEGVCAEQTGSWGCLSEFRVDGVRGVEETVVLGGAWGAIGHLCGVFESF